MPSQANIKNKLTGFHGPTCHVGQGVVSSHGCVVEGLSPASAQTVSSTRVVCPEPSS